MASGPIAHSGIEDFACPPIPGIASARLLALQFQFSQSERWPQAVLAREQGRQLDNLLIHCWANVPWLRPRIAATGWRPGVALTAEAWRAMPVLTRREVQEAGEALFALRVPDSHGRSLNWSTSGSTGTPVRGRTTEISQLLLSANVLREALWHRFDVSGALGAIRRDRSDAPRAEGRRLPNWGLAIAACYPTGPAYVLDTRSTTEEQVAWLRRTQPWMLATLPGITTLLAQYCLDHDVRLPFLRLVHTQGETVTDELRDLVRAAWGVKVVDVYSAEETGILALQCPEHDHYHVMAETHLVEVLRPDGGPCGPGEAGRVVVTPLSNFVMPLLRYELGDIATLGGPCACGRHLPVLRQIQGKFRHQMRLPDGSLQFTRSSGAVFARYPAIIQVQIAQVALAELEIRLLARQVLTGEEEASLTARIREEMGSYLTVRYRYVTEFPRPGGKFETFRREID